MTVHNVHAAIENLLPDFRAFWSQAHDRDVLEQRRLWNALYAGRHRDIFDLYFRDYASRDHLEAALHRYAQALPHIEEVAAVVTDHIQTDLPQLAALLGVDRDDATLHHVVLVGVFDSDAWEDSLRDRPTCFFAAERIASRLAAEVTVAHEVTHGLHALTNTDVAAGGNAVGRNLFLEGFAVYISMLAVQGLAEADYLWLGAPTTTQSQRVRDWLRACEAAWPTLRDQLLRDFDAHDEPTNGAYFITRPAYLRVEVPVRAGYFVGHRLVATLAAAHTPSELVRWPLERAISTLRNILVQAKSCPPAPALELAT